MNKKGQIFNNLSGLALGGLTIAIVLAVGFVIISNMNTQIVSTDGESSFCSHADYIFNQDSQLCVNATNASVTTGANLSAAWNASTTTRGALATIPTWIGLIFLVVIGGILIFLVSKGFRKT